MNVGSGYKYLCSKLESEFLTNQAGCSQSREHEVLSSGAVLDDEV